MIYKALIKLTNLLYKEFCNRYGNIISKDVVKEFLGNVDDLREVNAEYVDYLYDYVTDYNLIGC